MRYLLDTCVVSELVKPRPERKVVAWIESQAEERLHLSVLTLGEIRSGIAKLPASRRRATLEQWLDELRFRFDGRILDVTADVALIWGDIRAVAQRGGTALPVVDGLLAATALAFDMVAVTRDGAAFLRSGATVIDPWS